MAENSSTTSDVLQSNHQSKLSAEDVAKAVARHNRLHPRAKVGNMAGKSKAPVKH